MIMILHVFLQTRHIEKISTGWVNLSPFWAETNQSFPTKFEFWTGEFNFIHSTQDRDLGFMIPLAASGQKIQVQIVVLLRAS